MRDINNYTTTMLYTYVYTSHYIPVITIVLWLQLHMDYW